MKRLKFTLVILLALCTLAIMNLKEVGAQTGLATWTSPMRLSNEERKASEAYMTTDQYGFLHTFWSEEMTDNRSLIMYSRFDGEIWSDPIDMRVTPPFRSIGNVSSIVDQRGMLHLLWVEGQAGPVFYSHVPAHQANSAQNWPAPIRINIPAYRAKLQVDSHGNLHIVYSYNQSPSQGLYYLRSEDQGSTWTEPVWIDPDILADHNPSEFQFKMDDSDGLHLVWSYYAVMGTGGDWVRYANSPDGGKSWPVRITIDKNDLSSPGLNSFAYPLLAVNGDMVHIVWAAGNLLYRHHRYSLDGGLTWSDPVQFFGGLNGQAFDGMAFDGNGRLHFISQLRYPQGVYHGIWDGDRWSAPSMIYFITSSAAELVSENRIHAHATFPIIRDGNHLIVTLTDSPPEPNRGLYVMMYKLNDIPSLIRKPTPTPGPTDIPVSPPVLQPTQTPMRYLTPVSPPGELNDPGDASMVGSPIITFWFGIIPPVFLISILVAYRSIIQKKIR
jgi:hypothetical protein